jgi:DNA-binding transcriptional MerR regulator
MPTSGLVPQFNLKAVTHETGVPADTLRAWERRYGLPQPQRTRGGHRLYSERDIEVIKWLRLRQGDGLSISRAVELLQRLVASGHDPLETGTASSESRSISVPEAEGKLQALRRNWLNASLAFDEDTAEELLNLAFALYSVESVLTHMLLWSLRKIGEMSQQGTATVQQEHFLSSLTMQRLDALLAAAPHPNAAGTIVLACPESESHALPLQFLHLLLRRAGRKVVYLGADVPLSQLEETVRAVQPALVVMAAQQLATAATLRTAAAMLEKLRVPTAFGGRIFNTIPALQGQIPGSFIGVELGNAHEAIETLVTNPPAMRGRTREIPEAALGYRAALASIEVNVIRRFARTALPERHLAAANKFLGAALGAALELGSIAYLEADLDWIKVLLKAQGLPDDSLREYLRAYAGSVRAVMHREGDEIADWLEEHAGK